MPNENRVRALADFLKEAEAAQVVAGAKECIVVDGVDSLDFVLKKEIVADPNFLVAAAEVRVVDAEDQYVVHREVWVENPTLQSHLIWISKDSSHKFKL